MAGDVNDGPEVTPTFRDDDDPESQKVYSSRGRGAGLDDEGELHEVIPDFSSRVNQLKSSLGSKPSAVVSKEVKVDNSEKPKMVSKKTTSFSINPEDDINTKKSSDSFLINPEDDADTIKRSDWEKTQTNFDTKAELNKKRRSDWEKTQADFDTKSQNRNEKALNSIINPSKLERTGASNYTSKSFKDITNPDNEKINLGKNNKGFELAPHKTEADIAAQKGIAAGLSALAFIPGNPFRRIMGRMAIKEMQEPIVSTIVKSAQKNVQKKEPILKEKNLNKNALIYEDMKNASKRMEQNAAKRNEGRKESIMNERKEPSMNLKQGGRVVRMASGGSVRGHGIEQKGRTKGKYC
jgi:hypothetical protein